MMTFDQMADAIVEAGDSGFDEAIFVGRSNVLKIQAGARDGLVKLIEDGRRIEFMGLPVYVVDADNYFRVA